MRRSEVTLTQVTVGTRVSYQDMHNPRRVGTVTAIDSSAGRARYTVAWDEPLTLPAHVSDDLTVEVEIAETTSDLRTCGWKVES